MRARQRLREERKALKRERRAWLGAGARRDRVAEERMFCFALDRMKRRWREADRRADTLGMAVSRTVASSVARTEWFTVLGGVLRCDDVVRIRHRYHDEPAILMRESRFRALERTALEEAVHGEAGQERGVEASRRAR